MNRVRSFVVCTIALAVLAIPALADIATPIPPGGVYDGTCQNTSLTATLTPGSPYNSETARYGITCSGTFYSTITANLYIEDPNNIVCSSFGGACGPAVIGIKTKTWPVMGTQCIRVGGLRECFSVVKEEKPSSTYLSMTVQSTAKPFQARGVLEWITGPCTTFLGHTSCPTQSVTMSKLSTTLPPITTN